MRIPQMNEWRRTGRFTDIVVQVHDRKFNCHRVVLASASEYFDGLLGRDFHRSASNPVPMRDHIDVNVTDAETFELVLQYMYTGKVEITTKNVFHLLRAADYFKVKYKLEEKCALYIKKNLPIQNMFEAAKFAWIREWNPLLYTIAHYISHHLEDYWATSDFLESCFDVVKTIIDLSTLKEEIVVKATIQWINHRREDRWQYFNQLSRLGMMAGVSSTEIESMAQLLVHDWMSSHDVVSYLRHFKRPSVGKALTVYWFEHLTKKIFEVSINHTTRCNILHMGSGCVGVKKVVFNTSLIYSLNFICDESYDYGRLEFCSHALDGTKLNNLKSPYSGPMHHYFFYNGIQMYGLPRINRIYLYIAGMDTLHEYHCDTDTWCKLKTMTKELTWPTVAVCDTSNRLYLVCNNAGDEGPYTIQVYDCCTQQWTLLPQSNHAHKSPVWPAVCIYEGKLYVYNKFYWKFEVYDPSTQEWHMSKQNPYIDTSVTPRAIPFGDSLWLFSVAAAGQDEEQKNFYIVYHYKPGSNSWHKYPLIRAAIEKHENISNHAPRFLDAIVF